MNEYVIVQKYCKNCKHYDSFQYGEGYVVLGNMWADGKCKCLGGLIVYEAMYYDKWQRKEEKNNA